MGAVGAILGVHGRPGIGVSGADRNNVIEVRARLGSASGVLKFRAREYPCMLGRSGILSQKVEGDGGTPAGLYALREIRYRPDRLESPASGLVAFRTAPADGWCDDPADPSYNRLVHMPYQTDAEPMWRDDSDYDLLAVIGYNDAPTIPGAGSAIFLHVVRADGSGNFLPTSGCVSMLKDDLWTVLAACKPGTMIDIRTSVPNEHWA